MPGRITRSCWRTGCSGIIWSSGKTQICCIILSSRIIRSVGSAGFWQWIGQCLETGPGGKTGSRSKAWS